VKFSHECLVFSTNIYILQASCLDSKFNIIFFNHCWPMASQVLNLVTAICRSTLETVTTLFNVIFVPWRSSYEPIKSFLNDNGSKNVQTNSWRDRKLAELIFVGITVSFIENSLSTWQMRCIATDWRPFLSAVCTCYWSCSTGSHLAASTNTFQTSSWPLVQQPCAFTGGNLPCNAAKRGSKSHKQLPGLPLANSIPTGSEARVEG